MLPHLSAAVALLLLAVVLPRPAAASMCSGTASYKLTLSNFLQPSAFSNSIPPTGLVFSPPTLATHSARVSLLVAGAFASPQIRDVAEKGDNTALVALATELQSLGLVRDAVAADGPTRPGNVTELDFTVSCNATRLSVVAMIAPSPDWIVFIPSLDLYDADAAKFREYKWGDLRAYDAGTDSGRGFTDPADVSLDVPTVPQLNIALLEQDETDAFGDKAVGRFVVKRVE